MNIKRLVTVLFIAVIISGVFTLWLSHQVAKPRAAVAPVALQYAAAAQNLEAGEVLRPDQIKLITWPANIPLDGAHQKAEDVSGRALLFPLSAGEPILDRQLTAPGDGGGLPGKIPAGMRAISVRSNEVVGVAGFLQPGTHVDVLVTFHTQSSPDPVTSTILQDVEVLAAGQNFQPDSDMKADAANVVTLLVKPADAEKVVLASSQGDLHFVLRNGQDRGQVQDSGVNVSELNAAGGTSHPVVARAVRPAKPNAFTVRTILDGDKQTSESF